MQRLNLPPVDFTLKKEDSKVWIFDVIRKKYILLTPEEWVRQHFIHYITGQLQYPRSLVKVEGGLSYNQRQKRSDIVVFSREGAPWMVIECKAPEVRLTETAVLQASAYNASLRAAYIVITNGMTHYCASTDWAKGTTAVMSDLPPYP